MKLSLRRIKLEQIRYRNRQQNKKDANVAKRKSKYNQMYKNTIKRQ